MSYEKISTKILSAIFATGVLSFCGVAGETAMNITFPILMKEFSVTVGHNHLPISRCLRGALISLPQAFL